MECPNCGNYLNEANAGNYIRCEYCRSNVAVMSIVDDLSSSFKEIDISADGQKRINNLFKLAQIDLESKNYDSAYTYYQKILSESPFIWEAIINQAVCVFWMGREDMNHMKEVISLLNKADKLSNNNNKVDDVRNDIAHNLALIASHKERYGSNIQWSIDCLKISKSLVNKNEERDKILFSYCELCEKEIAERLQSGLKRDKKNYDPTISDLKTLKDLIYLTDGRRQGIMNTYLAFSDFKSRKHSKDLAFEEEINGIKNLYQQVYNRKTFPTISVPLVGIPKINI